jgi:hypothetical protein
MVKDRSDTQWPEDREVGDTVCSLHRAQGDEENGFLGLASTPWSSCFPGLGLKTGSCGLVTWPKNLHDGFVVWASKPIGLRFVGCAQNQWEDEDGVGHAPKYSGLLHLGFPVLPQD